MIFVYLVIVGILYWSVKVKHTNMKVTEWWDVNGTTAHGRDFMGQKRQRGFVAESRWTI